MAATRPNKTSNKTDYPLIHFDKNNIYFNMVLNLVINYLRIQHPEINYHIALPQKPAADGTVKEAYIYQCMNTYKPIPRSINNPDPAQIKIILGYNQLCWFSQLNCLTEFTNLLKNIRPFTKKEKKALSAPMQIILKNLPDCDSTIIHIIKALLLLPYAEAVQYHRQLEFSQLTRNNETRYNPISLSDIQTGMPITKLISTLLANNKGIAMASSSFSSMSHWILLEKMLPLVKEKGVNTIYMEIPFIFNSIFKKLNLGKSSWMEIEDAMKFYKVDFIANEGKVLKFIKSAVKHNIKIVGIDMQLEIDETSSLLATHREEKISYTDRNNFMVRMIEKDQKSESPQNKFIIAGIGLPHFEIAAANNLAIPLINMAFVANELTPSDINEEMAQSNFRQAELYSSQLEPNWDIELLFSKPLAASFSWEEINTCIKVDVLPLTLSSNLAISESKVSEKADPSIVKLLGYDGLLFKPKSQSVLSLTTVERAAENLINNIQFN